MRETEVDRLGGWIQTYSGKRFWPLAPRPEDVEIEDIAHALSMICRFCGHCKEFYSVAQHSVLVSMFCDPEDAKWGLLHDASEAYIADLGGPIKKSVTGYVWIETFLMEAILSRFGLKYPQPPSIKKADLLLLATEGRDLMTPCTHTWEVSKENGYEVLACPILPLPPKEAEAMFLARWEGLQR